MKKVIPIIFVLLFSLLLSANVHAQSFPAPVEADFDSEKEFESYLIGTPAEIQEIFTDARIVPGSVDEFLTSIEQALPDYKVPWGAENQGTYITISQYRDQIDGDTDYSKQTPTYTPSKFHKMTYATSEQALANLRTKISSYVAPTEKYYQELAFTKLKFPAEDSSGFIVVPIFSADLFALYVQEFTAVSAEAGKNAIRKALLAYTKAANEGTINWLAENFNQTLETIYDTQSRLSPDMPADELVKTQKRGEQINTLRANYEKIMRGKSYPLSEQPLQQIQPATAAYVRALFAIGNNGEIFLGKTDEQLRNDGVYAGQSSLEVFFDGFDQDLAKVHSDVKLLSSYVDACTDAANAMNLIMVFKEPKDRTYLYDTLLGIQETLVDATYDALPGVLDKLQYVADLNNGRPTQPAPQALVDDAATWNFANELAMARLSNEHWNTGKQVAITTLSIAAGIGGTVFSGGNPWVGAGVAMTVAGATGAYEVAGLQEMDDVAHGAFTAQQFKGLPLSSDALINYYDETVDYAIKATVANIALAGVSGGMGAATEFIKIPGRAGLTIFVKAIAETEIGAADGLLSALADGRISNQEFIVQEHVLAGGSAESAPSAIKGIIQSVALSAVMGGVSEGGFGTLGHVFEIVSDSGTIQKIIRSDGVDITNQQIRVHIDVEANPPKVTRFWEDGTPLTKEESAAIDERIAAMFAPDNTNTNETKTASEGWYPAETPQTQKTTEKNIEGTKVSEPAVTAQAANKAIAADKDTVELEVWLMFRKSIDQQEMLTTPSGTYTVEQWGQRLNMGGKKSAIWYAEMTVEQRIQVTSAVMPKRMKQIVADADVYMNSKANTGLGDSEAAAQAANKAIAADKDTVEFEVWLMFRKSVDQQEMLTTSSGTYTVEQWGQRLNMGGKKSAIWYAEMTVEQRIQVSSAVMPKRMKQIVADADAYMSSKANTELSNVANANGEQRSAKLPPRGFKEGQLNEAKAAARKLADLNKTEFSIVQEPLTQGGGYTLFEGSRNRTGTSAFGDASSPVENEFFGVEFICHVQPLGLEYIPSKADLEIVARIALSSRQTEVHTVLGYLNGVEVETIIQATYLDGTVTVTSITGAPEGMSLPADQVAKIKQRVNEINNDLADGKVDEINMDQLAAGEDLATNSGDMPTSFSSAARELQKQIDSFKAGDDFPRVFGSGLPTDEKSFLTSAFFAKLKASGPQVMGVDALKNIWSNGALDGNLIKWLPPAKSLELYRQSLELGVLGFTLPKGFGPIPTDIPLGEYIAQQAVLGEKANYYCQQLFWIQLSYSNFKYKKTGLVEFLKTLEPTQNLQSLIAIIEASADSDAFEKKLKSFRPVKYVAGTPNATETPSAKNTASSVPAPSTAMTVPMRPYGSLIESDDSDHLNLKGILPPVLAEPEYTSIVAGMADTIKPKTQSEYDLAISELGLTFTRLTGMGFDGSQVKSIFDNILGHEGPDGMKTLKALKRKEAADAYFATNPITPRALTSAQRTSFSYAPRFQATLRALSGTPADNEKILLAILKIEAVDFRTADQALGAHFARFASYGWKATDVLDQLDRVPEGMNLGDALESLKPDSRLNSTTTSQLISDDDFNSAQTITSEPTLANSSSPSPAKNVDFAKPQAHSSNEADISINRMNESDPVLIAHQQAKFETSGQITPTGHDIVFRYQTAKTEAERLLIRAEAKKMLQNLFLDSDKMAIFSSVLTKYQLPKVLQATGLSAHQFASLTVEQQGVLIFKFIKSKSLTNFSGEDPLAMNLTYLYWLTIQQQNAAFQNEIPGLTRDFIARFRTGVLKLPITETEILARLSKARISITDPLTTPMHDYGYNGSQYILINLMMVPDMMRWDVIVHEMFHEISGRTFTVASRGDETPQIVRTRSGLDVTGKLRPNPDGTFDRQGRLIWLNEAITETLAIRLSGIPEQFSACYIAERNLLKKMLTKGKQPISEELYINAYFENINDATSTRDAYHVLTDAIRNAFDDTWLVRVDKLARENPEKFREFANSNDVNPDLYSK